MSHTTRTVRTTRQGPERTLVIIEALVFALALSGCNHVLRPSRSPESPTKGAKFGGSSPAHQMVGTDTSRPSANPPERRARTARPKGAAPATSSRQSPADSSWRSVHQVYQCGHGSSGKWLVHREGKGVEKGKQWFHARLLRARRGRPELLQISLVRRSAGWGCDSPWYFVGTDPDTQDGPVSLDIDGEDLLPEPDREGWVRIVEGYLTGVVASWKSEDSQDSGEDCGQNLYEFRVLRLVHVQSPEGALARIVGTCKPDQSR